MHPDSTVNLVRMVFPVLLVLQVIPVVLAQSDLKVNPAHQATTEVPDQSVPSGLLDQLVNQVNQAHQVTMELQDLKGS